MTIMERAGASAARNYVDFLASKRIVAPAVGREVSIADVHPSLFGFQAALVRWAVRKGRCALFTATGTGKTRMAVEWARLVGERTLIVAPPGRGTADRPGGGADWGRRALCAQPGRCH